MSRTTTLKMLGGGLLVVGTLAYSRPARACGACVCDEESPSIINLIRDVPLNLKVPLRVLEPGEAAPWLERADDGTRVAITVERRDEGPAVWWLQADEDLAPNTEYFIQRESGVDAGFTTGAARDASAPTLAEVSATGGGDGAVCGASIGGLLTLGGADDGPTFAVWVELELDVAGTAKTLFTDYSFAQISVGHSDLGCFGATEIAGMVAGHGYPGRARLHDAAGNVSEWRTFAFNAQAVELAGCGEPGEPSAGGAAGAAGTAGQGAVSSPGGSTSKKRTSEGCGVAPAAPFSASAGTIMLALASLLGRRRSGARRARAVPLL